MSDQDCWKSEYDWLVSPRSGISRETVLCVLFDHGTQRQFSSVRITLSYGKDATPKQIGSWHITPKSSSPSVASRVPTEVQDTVQNDASLPICNIVFIADRHSARSRITSKVKRVCGEVFLGEGSSPNDSSNTIFEFDQPLTENTQSVSVSFTSSYLMYTPMTHGIFTHPSEDHSATVGRVVRVLPAAPTSKRRTISLSLDLLLLVFENLCFPVTRLGWRKDILACALVCRQWICALDKLLVDFRSWGNQDGFPPDITGLANGVIARPSLALGIKCFSISYFQKFPTWDLDPRLRFQKASFRWRWRHDDAQVSNALVPILCGARNLRTLHLDSLSLKAIVSPDELADALCGLSKLEEFRGNLIWLNRNMARMVSCIAKWPSLKRLSLTACHISLSRGYTSDLSLGDPALPLLPPVSCSLTELYLWGVPIQDNELACIVSTSGATLERLILSNLSKLTNAGLTVALNTICRSLTSIVCDGLPSPQDAGEEYALDVTISRMARLTDLQIGQDDASERMLERRTEAFLQQTTPALSKVRLTLSVKGPDHPRSGLLRMVIRDWPGWEICT